MRRNLGAREHGKARPYHLAADQGYARGQHTLGEVYGSVTAPPRKTQ